ncbi:MAG: helix-turn-helix domain-containing protein [Clostridia bacterium]|nr:helix-turn-helix domain-containing protein [Clostridia bacterium]
MIYNFETLSFQILTVDRFFHREGFFNVKARPFSALSFRINGTAVFEIGNTRLLAKPGDVLFLPANTPYKVEYSVGESIVVHFEHCNYFEVENACVGNSLAIGVRFQHLLEVWNQQHSANQAKSIIYDILDKMSSDQKMSISDTAIANCIHYIDEHFCDPNIDVETVCGIAFISVSSLQRAFTKYFGLSPKQYLIQLRMNRALDLLTENVLSVKEISFACGFTDEKYFSRAFKKKYGYPPSQFRKNIIV